MIDATREHGIIIHLLRKESSVIVDHQESGDTLLAYLVSMLALVPYVEMDVERCIILLVSAEGIRLRSVEMSHRSSPFPHADHAAL